MKLIFNELNYLFKKTNKKSLNLFINLILKNKNKRIIGLGAGRMGYSLQSFIMRLSHLKFKSYMIGDTSLPRIKKGDIIIINSSSGETISVRVMAEIAKKKSCILILFTHNKDSTIGKMSDLVISYPKIKSEQLMKSLYEQYTFLLFDFLSLSLFKKLSYSSSEVSSNHSILE